MMLSVIRLSITNRVRNTKQYCRIPILVELNCKLVIVVLNLEEIRNILILTYVIPNYNLVTVYRTSIATWKNIS